MTLYSLYFFSYFIDMYSAILSGATHKQDPAFVGQHYFYVCKVNKIIIIIKKIQVELADILRWNHGSKWLHGAWLFHFFQMGCAVCLNCIVHCSPMHTAQFAQIPEQWQPRYQLGKLWANTVLQHAAQPIEATATDCTTYESCNLLHSFPLTRRKPMYLSCDRSS